MEIKKVKVMSKTMCEIELIDGKISSISNMPGASGYDVLQEFLNNPKNKKNIEYVDTQFVNAKQSKIQIRSGYLVSTDWYVIRVTESKVSIPTEIKTKREKARTEISSIRLVENQAELDALNLENDDYYNI